jgi:hypothetical protein
MKGYSDEFFDWIYVDDNNLFDGVCRNIEARKNKLRTNCYIMFCNYTTRGALELIGYGVIPAVSGLVNEGVGLDFGILCILPRWYMS